MAERSLIFGPVPSRRLGYSLGVDLVPRKTCNYDCLYCEVGKTTQLTTARRAWVPVAALIDQLRQRLDHTRPDYVTLAGSGEPTLHLQLDEIVLAIKEMTDVPLAILTNGSLLGDDDVARALAPVDLVIPSLDAGSEETFRRINRPCGGMSFGEMVSGLIQFRRGFPGLIWLEVFLLAGINDAPAEISAMVEVAQRVRPDRIQINTAVRPVAEPGATAVPWEALQAIARRFVPQAEVIAPFASRREAGAGAVDDQRILDLVARRPCTLIDLAAGLGVDPAALTRQLQRLTGAGQLVTTDAEDGARFFTSPTVRFDNALIS